MTTFNARSTAMFSAAVLMLIATGCATKKHVREVVGPVEARVSQAEKKNVEQQAAIGELGNSVSRADERAMDADRKAREAGEAAKAAQGRADTAYTQAQTASTRADSANQLAEATRNRLGQITDNIDNYKLVTTESVLFGLNKYQLTKQTKEQLDQAVAQIQNSKNYVLEIEGFTDPTGPANHNLELSRKRADAVVRYLTTQHNIPLRKINVLGVGEDEKTEKTREARKQARRVEIRVFALDLGSGVSAGAAPTGTSNQTSNTTGAQDTASTVQRQ
jgi:outer membrane protein OmpA-like peptidoglycan-associated protein